VVVEVGVVHVRSVVVLVHVNVERSDDFILRSSSLDQSLVEFFFSSSESFQRKVFVLRPCSGVVGLLDGWME
jgi:hypothetical protein